MIYAAVGLILLGTCLGLGTVYAVWASGSKVRIPYPYSVRFRLLSKHRLVPYANYDVSPGRRLFSDFAYRIRSRHDDPSLVFRSRTNLLLWEYLDELARVQKVFHEEDACESDRFGNRLIDLSMTVQLPKWKPDNEGIQLQSFAHKVMGMN
jgi:hypothetical protein